MVTRGYTQSRSPRRYRAASNDVLEVNTDTDGNKHFKLGTSVVSVVDGNKRKHVDILNINDKNHIKPLLSAVQNAYPKEIFVLHSRNVINFESKSTPYNLEKAFARALYNMQCTEPDNPELIEKPVEEKPSGFVDALRELFTW